MHKLERSRALARRDKVGGVLVFQTYPTVHLIAFFAHLASGPCVEDSSGDVFVTKTLSIHQFETASWFASDEVTLGGISQFAWKTQTHGHMNGGAIYCDDLSVNDKRAMQSK